MPACVVAAAGAVAALAAVELADAAGTEGADELICPPHAASSAASPETSARPIMLRMLRRFIARSLLGFKAFSFIDNQVYALKRLVSDICRTVIRLHTRD